MLRICDLQNFHHQEHTLDLVEIPEQSDLEEAEEPESESKERAMTVFSLTEALGLAEAGIRVFQDVDWKEKRVATTGQGAVCMLACYEEVLKKQFFSCQTSLSDFYKSSSKTCASPPVLLDVSNDDTDEPPTFRYTGSAFSLRCQLFIISFFNFF